MSGGLFVNTVKMDGEGNNTINNAEDLSKAINSMISSVEALLRNWTSGAGRNAFEMSFESEKAFLQEFARMLSEHGFDVLDASRALAKADADAADASRSMDNGLREVM